MRKLLFIAISVLLFSVNAFAQAWPSSSGTRPTFSGFGTTYENNNESVLGTDESTTETFAGDYITSKALKAEDDDIFGDEDNPGNPGVPIIESILGLLGLGGAYLWKLAAKKKKED